jgi:ribosome-binding protein aMBF1 (putative translation factor)
MRIEVTDHIFDGRCEVQTEVCYARDSGAVGTVRTPEGEVTVCGACLQHMARTGKWRIPGSRPQPRPPQRSAPAVANLPSV